MRVRFVQQQHRLWIGVKVREQKECLLQSAPAWETGYLVCASIAAKKTCLRLFICRASRGGCGCYP
jgi:hypothetical protein